MTGRIPQPFPFLDLLSGHIERERTSSADRPIRLAKVDPGYLPLVGWPGAAPPTRVTFEGETTLSTKAYPIANGFVPSAGQRVWLLPLGNGYLVAGAVNGQTSQGFWQSADGVDSGVEFGHGSYWDTNEGLVLEGDATIQGEISGAVARGLVVGQTFTGAQTTSSTVEKIMDHLTGWVPDVTRRYELRWMLAGQGSVASDVFAVRFRYLIGTGPLTAAGTQFMRLDIHGLGLTVPHQYVWPIPALAAGTYAIGASVARQSGTGTWDASVLGTGRRLEIHDVGRRP